MASVAIGRHTQQGVRQPWPPSPAVRDGGGDAKGPTPAPASAGGRGPLAPPRVLERANAHETGTVAKHQSGTPRIEPVPDRTEEFDVIHQERRTSRPVAE